MGNFGLLKFARDYTKSHWAFTLALGGIAYTYYSYARHRDATMISFKGKSKLFSSRKIPEGQDPWKY